MKPKYTVGYRATIGLSEALLDKLESRSMPTTEITYQMGVPDYTQVQKMLEPDRNFSLFFAAMLADILGYELKIELVKKG